MSSGLSKALYDTDPSKAHNPLDKKDAQTHPNTVDAAHLEHRAREKAEEETNMKNRKPTELAQDHGNKPSRGAEIDEELRKDDELRMKEKGIIQ
ncbi:hypothetical protein DACRYDRAFT_21627 [Dacryopinax primogenitus]|uniref:Uncharacterized protein n=1 Tax=Dacryopinax primogenitus (strain DJM 731) TaxID=1858805 RepID=M5G2V4_DACPD|nr:uncharacterized protein DACRYDRAFT_21627 [Dacryopinax primogenitus]EJU02555.1 hypothetical protein DACRYDRAFT_21627 [Dacryopinax primogenitus]